MARKKKKGVLPRVEVILILVFFLCFIIWAMKECSTKKTAMEQLAMEQDLEEAEAVASENLETNAANTAVVTGEETRPMSEARRQELSGGTNTISPARVQTEYTTKLFVSIDGLKFRNGPSMDSSVIMVLPINYELTFMNEVSDSTQEISMGNGVIANERWIKVQHPKGHEGRVYGAGVNYFKLNQ